MCRGSRGGQPEHWRGHGQRKASAAPVTYSPNGSEGSSQQYGLAVVESPVTRCVRWGRRVQGRVLSRREYVRNRLLGGGVGWSRYGGRATEGEGRPAVRCGCG